jgi:hypothetical protein
MDEELKAYLDAKFADVRAEAVGMEARIVSVIASEVGTLHTQLKNAEERLTLKIDAIDARQRRDASLTTTLMELVVKQTRWHEQSDNAVADLTAHHAKLERRLEELGGKQ